MAGCGGDPAPSQGSPSPEAIGLSPEQARDAVIQAGRCRDARSEWPNSYESLVVCHWGDNPLAFVLFQTHDEFTSSTCVSSPDARPQTLISTGWIAEIGPGIGQLDSQLAVAQAVQELLGGELVDRPCQYLQGNSPAADTEAQGSESSIGELWLKETWDSFSPKVRKRVCRAWWDDLYYETYQDQIVRNLRKQFRAQGFARLDKVDVEVFISEKCV